MAVVGRRRAIGTRHFHRSSRGGNGDTKVGPLGEDAVHLETAAKLLSLLEANSVLFSKCALKPLANRADFDSAIRR
jgi:hypothetical protein